jgi:hypothetical protein
VLAAWKSASHVPRRSGGKSDGADGADGPTPVVAKAK